MGASDAGTLRIRVSALDVVARAARMARPAECCGALLGPPPEPGGNDADRVVYAAVPAPDAGARTGPATYWMGPDAVRWLEGRAAEAGLAVVGYYHSHPDTDATPSAADLRAAWPWYVYLIQPAGGTRAAAAWILDEECRGFRRMTIEALE